MSRVAPEKIIELLGSDPGAHLYRGWKIIDGRPCAIGPLIYTIALYIDVQYDLSYHYRYCYTEFSDALYALHNWDGKGEPPGDWIVRKGLNGDYHNPRGVHARGRKPV